jgi:general secretion pathway protein C
MDILVSQTMSSAPTARPHLLEQLEHWLARRWVVIALNVAALTLLALSAAQWTWRLLTPVSTPTAAPAIVTNSNVADYDLSALLGANLFGQAVPLSSGRVSLENIPLSSLNLVVTGVFATPKSAIALISADGAPETPYAIGQEIVAGASLYAVYADRVLIRRGGVTESLMLKEAGAALPSGSIATGEPAPRDSGQPDAPRTDARSFNVDRQQMTQQLQKPEFLSQALMVPNARAARGRRDQYGKRTAGKHGGRRDASVSTVWQWSEPNQRPNTPIGQDRNASIQLAIITITQ